MFDYFSEDDNSDRMPNKDAVDRMQERPRFYLKEALEYDKQYVNKILNHENLSIKDKVNIADVVSYLSNELLNTTETTKSFEDFTIEIMGREWFDNMIAKWLQRKNNEMAAKLNCPELFNPKGIFFMKPKDDE